MNDFKTWLKKLEEELGGQGTVNPRVFIKKHISSLRYLYLQDESVEDVLVYYVDELISNKKQEYVEKLQSKKGVVSHSDSVMYNGKLLRRCPKGTTKVGNSCAPMGPNSNVRPRLKRRDLDGAARRQIEKLSKAKSSKDVHQAYNVDKNRDRKTPKAP